MGGGGGVGGSIVLEMARTGEMLRGVTSFHGGLVTEHQALPGLPLAYNAKTDQVSWAELQSFLQLVFK